MPEVLVRGIITETNQQKEHGMPTYPDYFDILLSNIQPDPQRLATAQTILPDVRDYLKKHEALKTVNPHTRLAGSYPRDTAIDALKDVDTLAIIHKDYLDEKPSAVITVLYRMLEKLPESIGGSVTVDLRKQRRSIHVCFANLDFHLDVVPVVMPTTIDEVLRVPDRGWEEWVETHPLGYQQWLSELNKKHGGKVVPLIKLTKHWRDCHFVYKRPKSYWLECMVVRHIDRGWVTTDSLSYAEMFTALLKSIYDRYAGQLKDPKAKPPHIPDPMLSNNVAWNWERSHFEAFMARVEESSKWAQRALEKDVEHEAEGVELWQQVFDGTFPTMAEVQARKAAEAARLGILSVASTGRVITTPSSTVKSVLSPQHRFFGDENE